jgi:TPR repeat protein
MAVPRNYQTAESRYKKAADLGNADAMDNLGALLENDRGVSQNLDAARAWYVKGAALNGRLAMHHLGATLEDGRGTSQNLSEAKFWYEHAAALKYPRRRRSRRHRPLTGARTDANQESQPRG